MGVGLLERLDEQSRSRLLAEAFERSVVAKAVASLAAGSFGDLVEVNAAFCALVGYRRADLIGRSSETLFDPVDQSSVRASLRALAEADPPDAPAVVAERQLVRQDGTRMWVSTRAVVTHDVDGRSYVMVDYTASSQRPTVTDQRDDRGLLDGLVSATPDLLLVTTPAGQVVRANASWAQLGWSEADLQGMDITRLIHPDDIAASAAAAATVTVGSGSAVGFRNRYRTRGGDYRWMQWNGAELAGQGLLVAIARDVTDQVAVEEALRRSEEQSRAAFDASPLGMAIADEDGRFLRVNAAYATMLGRDPGDVVGHSYRDFTHPDDLDVSEQQRLDTGRQPGTAVRFDKRQVRPDGSVVWARLGLIAISGPDGAAHRLVQAEDITAAVETQERAARETARLRTTIAVQREVTAAAGDRATVLRLMAERALAVITGGDAAVVALLDPDRAALSIAATTGAVAAEQPRIPVTGSLFGLAVTTATTLRCDDTHTDGRVSAAVSAAVGVRSLVVAPLLGVDGPLGVLSVSSPTPRAFTEADEQQLTLLADALTGVLRHADDATRRQALLQESAEANRQLQLQRGQALAALERLAHSERRFAEVFDHSPVAKIVVGLRGPDRGRITLANPAFARLLGYPADDTAGLTVGHLLAEPSPALDQALTALAAGRESRTVRESVLRHRDGHLIYVAGHTSVITDADGPVSAVLQMLDVTRERAAAQALARSEDLFRTAFVGSAHGLIVTDEHGVFQQANPAAGILTGRTASSLVGLSSLDITDPGDTDTVERASATLRTGPRTQYVTRLRHPDGRTVEVRATVTMIPGPAGQAWWLGQLEDITAERAAAQAAEREAQRLRDTLLVQREVTAAAADRDTAITVVAQRAVHLFPAADGAVVELLDGDSLRYAATAGNLAAALGTRIPVAGSLSGAVLATGEPVHSAHTSTDPRVNRAMCARLGIGSMLVTPLHAEATIIGVLKVSAVRPGAFDDTDVQQLGLLADSLSSALRHADDAAHHAALLAERTAALAALEASEARFQLAFDNSPLGLTVSSVEPEQFGRYLHANPAMTAITGYSTAELTAMTFRDLQHPDDLASTGTYLQQLLAGERDTVTAERRYRHKDGHTIWVTVAVALVRQAGQARYLVNQVEDITERRAALAQLHRQAALLQLIPAAVIVRGLDGRILWWNQGAEDLYGWPLPAATGKITHRLLATSFPHGSNEADQTRTLQHEGRWEGQLEHVTARGRTVTVLSRQILQLDDHPGYHPPQGDIPDPGGTGMNIGLAGTVLEVNTDVTAARTAERALAESEQRFKAQFTNSAVGQIVRGLDGTLLAVNPAYAAMLGHTPEQLVGGSSMGRLHPDDLTAATGHLAGLFAGDADSFTQQGRLRHADGHWVDTEATITLVRDNTGQPDHFIGVMADITARRDAERARDQAAAALAARNTELEDANRFKLDLIGMLGHEIGNPLTTIRGHAEILADDWAGLTEAHRARAITAIHRQANRLDDIVNDVLDMVRIEADTIRANRRPLPVRAQIDQALTATPTSTDQVPVHGDDVVVLADPGHVQHILTNLISNAAKYGGGATAIRIAEHRDGQVQIRVEDEGPGVPEEFRDRLFQRLARAERDATTVRGTGLGLYIVQTLAQANGGDVHHEPNPTGGSIFILNLDRADP